MALVGEEGEDADGGEYVRHRYRPGAEDERRSDAVRLTATATTFGAGDTYDQSARDLHASAQLPGTVTAIRCRWVEAPELTVCLREGDPWRSGLGRDATRGEIGHFAARALEWF